MGVCCGKITFVANPIVDPIIWEDTMSRKPCFALPGVRAYGVIVSVTSLKSGPDK